MKETKILYESYNGGNVIVQTDNGYCLVNHNGDTVLFDCDNVLKAVIQNIKKYGNLQYQINNSNGWYFADSGGRPIFTLSQLILATYRKTSLEALKGKKTMVKNGNRNDLRIANLYIVKNEIFRYENYIVIINEDNMKVSTADYSPELFDILNSFEFYYNKKKDYFYINIDNKPVDIEYFCWAFYKQGANKANIIDIVSQIKKEFINVSPNDRKSQLTIDHKNGLHWDNRKCNLQVITHGLNSIKGNCTAKLKQNQFFIPVASDNITGSGEIAGRIDYKFDLCGAIYFLLTKDLACDIEILPYEKDNAKRVDSLTRFTKKDTMPEDKIKLPISSFQYGLLALKGLVWLADMCRKKNINNTKKGALNK